MRDEPDAMGGNPGGIETVDVAVVGGGITGLAAANRLRELDPSLSVAVLEAGAKPGGVLGTDRRDGFLIDSSADSFITNVPWAIDLCRRLGLEDRLIQTAERNRRSFVVRAGRLEPIPDGLIIMAPSKIGPMVRTRILSVPGKLRLAMERFLPKGDGSDESLAGFARRRFGREAYDRLIQPLVGGMYTGDPERLSVKATMPRFLEMEQRDGSLIKSMRAAGGKQTGGSGARYSLFVGLEGGMSDLVEAIVARLPEGTVRTGSPVRRISRDADGWRLDVGDGPTTLRARSVILATSARATAGLLREVAPEAAAEVGAITSTSSAVVSLGFRRDRIAHPLDGFGFVVPFIEDRRILSGSFSSVKFANRAPEGSVLIRVFMGGSKRPELVDADDNELVRIATEELASLLGVRGGPETSSVSRWREVMPQYEVGHLERIADVEARVGALDGLELAGNWLRGIGVPMCIHSGEQAAGRAASRIGQAAGRAG
ncbi:protoporphyrinogen oxidase [Planctomyces sp. SH-PL62]|uniref:protoporphyrinogen oxidase n=1 Tax=Planctomyces sp. SH-PL62 TaxID=1636152 RepID=UPI00078E3CAF|nr:protoporphyrinogen oxidase [Planctomyces sp. SH-PL62]AMV36244.1 Protoporphyrinogen oxidase [Planctomyces sp. SH-PL62]